MSHLLVARDIGRLKVESYNELKEELIDGIMVELNKLIKTLRPKP